MQYSKTSPLKSGESSEKSSGENRVKSCHVCGCHGFFGPDFHYWNNHQDQALWEGGSFKTCFRPADGQIFMADVPSSVRRFEGGGGWCTCVDMLRPPAGGVSSHHLLVCRQHHAAPALEGILRGGKGTLHNHLRMNRVMLENGGYVLSPQQTLLPSRDVIISSQICGWKLQRVFHIRWWMWAAHMKQGEKPKDK